VSTPIGLPQFTVQQYMEEGQTPGSNVSGDPVTVAPLNILVTFTPSQAEIQVTEATPIPFTVYLDPVVARVDTDGYLKGINSEPVYYDDAGTIYQVPQLSSAGLPVTPVYAGADTPAYWIDADGNEVPNPPGLAVWGVRLVSNSSLLALANPLMYRVNYSRGDVVIHSFTFAAPSTDVTVDLSTVERLGPAPASVTSIADITPLGIEIVTAPDVESVANLLGYNPPKQVSIGDQGHGIAAQGNATSTVGTGEMMFVVGPKSSGISALFEHWYTDAGSGADTDPAGPISFNASVRVVSSSNPGTLINTIHRITFNGRTTATLDPGGKVISDPLGITVAQGDEVAVRTFLASGTAYAPRETWGTSGGPGGFTATTDLTAPGSAAIPVSGGIYYGPAALMGFPEGAADALSCLIIGDSISSSGADTAVFTIPHLGEGGFGIRALTGQGGLLNVAVPGDSATGFQSSDFDFHRLANAAYCNVALIGYGSNDFIEGTTAAQLEAIHLNEANELRRLGIRRVFILTVCPRVTTTDGCGTLTGQTPMSGEAQRVLYNTWARGRCPIDPSTKAPVAVGTSGALLAGDFGHPLTGFFDVASKVESGLNSGKWLPALRTAHGSITSGDNAVTSSDANFSGAIQENGGDLGSGMVLMGGGASGAPLSGPAVLVTPPTTAYLLLLASTTVTNATLYIGTVTAEGVHPNGRGVVLMASAIDLAKLAG
jgi:hypothetical protein